MVRPPVLPDRWLPPAFIRPRTSGPSVLVEPGRKSDFISYLKHNGIASGEHYPIPISGQEALRRVEHEVASDVAVATRIARSEVSLPIHPYLSDEEVARVIEVSNAFG